MAAVDEKVLALNPSSSSGPDDMHSHILKEAANSLSVLLARIIRQFLDTGHLPGDWNVACIIQV